MDALKSTVISILLIKLKSLSPELFDNFRINDCRRGGIHPLHCGIDYFASYLYIMNGEKTQQAVCTFLRQTVIYC